MRKKKGRKKMKPKKKKKNRKRENDTFHPFKSFLLTFYDFKFIIGPKYIGSPIGNNSIDKVQRVKRDKLMNYI